LGVHAKLIYKYQILYLDRITIKGKKLKVSICIAHLAYNASNSLFATNPSCQPHSHHLQPADTG